MVNKKFDNKLFRTLDAVENVIRSIWIWFGRSWTVIRRIHKAAGFLRNRDTHRFLAAGSPLLNLDIRHLIRDNLRLNQDNPNQELLWNYTIEG